MVDSSFRRFWLRRDLEDANARSVEFMGLVEKCERGFAVRRMHTGMFLENLRPLHPPARPAHQDLFLRACFRASSVELHVSLLQSLQLATAAFPE